MKPIIPCIWLDDQAEQAAAFYIKAFRDGRVTATSHYPEHSDNPSKKPRGSVLTVAFEIAGQGFTALNGGPQFVPNQSLSFFANVPSPAEADALYAALLANGGKELMAIGTYPWSERYGWVKDRFNVSWQVMAGRKPGEPTIVPCLMFSGKQAHKAEEAMRFYTSVFPNSRIDATERYAKAEGPEGKIKHGRFVVDGQPMVAMDSHVDHDVTFNEALSLQIMCKDQAEVHRYWEALGAGGEKGPCGWLKDRFGVSWQVVPAKVTEWLTTKDVSARDRVFAEIMKMKELDIATLERAAAGA